MTHLLKGCFSCRSEHYPDSLLWCDNGEINGRKINSWLCWSCCSCSDCLEFKKNLIKWEKEYQEQKLKKELLLIRQSWKLAKNKETKELNKILNRVYFKNNGALYSVIRNIKELFGLFKKVQKMIFTINEVNGQYNIRGQVKGRTKWATEWVYSKEEAIKLFNNSEHSGEELILS